MKQRNDLEIRADSTDAELAEFLMLNKKIII